MRHVRTLYKIALFIFAQNQVYFGLSVTAMCTIRNTRCIHGMAIAEISPMHRFLKVITEKVTPVDALVLSEEDLARVAWACEWVKVTAGFLPYVRDFLMVRLAHHRELNYKIADLNAFQTFRLWEWIKEEQWSWKRITTIRKRNWETEMIQAGNTVRFPLESH